MGRSHRCVTQPKRVLRLRLTQLLGNRVERERPSLLVANNQRSSLTLGLSRASLVFIVGIHDRDLVFIFLL